MDKMDALAAIEDWIVLAPRTSKDPIFTIGVLSYAHDALEKAIAMEPIEDKEHWSSVECGRCKVVLQRGQRYCHECGQKVFIEGDEDEA